MDFATKLASIQSEAQQIRESLSCTELINPGSEDARLEGPAKERGFRSLPPARRMRESRKFTKFMAEVVEGKRPLYHLKEAMTVSDFPNLFGDLLYRQLLGNYTPYPVTFPRWCRIYDVNDFRTLHLYTIDGGQGILPSVSEMAPYSEIKFVEGAYGLKVGKYGQRYGISFEMVTNDDLNAFANRPMLMAVAARRSEEYLATGLLMDVNGPNASFFTDANSNIVPGNPILSIQGLQTAMTTLKSQKDKDGQPIVITAMELIVPPSLEITALNILHATQLRINSSGGNPAGALPGGGTLDQYLYTTNWMNGRVNLSVNPYLPYISTNVPAGAATAVGNTSWALVANPNDMASRPAFAFGYLRGRREPQLFMKDPNSYNLGGGLTDAMEGDFDTDSIDYKLRHIFGGIQVDPKMAVASNGTQVAD